MNRRIFLGAVGAAATSDPAVAKPLYRLAADPAGKTLEGPDGKTVFTYLTNKPEGVALAGNSACCFHPLNTPSGVRVTEIAPADHPNHRGIFFAWQSLDFHRRSGVVRGDFWGWGRLAPTEGRVIRNREVRLVQSAEAFAEMAIRNDWTIDGETVMTESTIARASEKQAARVLDLVYTFESDGDVTVNRVAFTGLCVRCRSDGQGYFSNSSGRVDLPDSEPLRPEMNWPAADWYSYTIALTNGKTVTAAVIDHPANPKSTWHEPRPVTFLNPCVSALGAVKIPAGMPLVLRYRVLAIDGDVRGRAIESLAAEWRAVK